MPASNVPLANTSGDNQPPVDLRSDTVTRPGPEMMAAMASAALGDDVYGEDPTVTALEARVADILGLEAGLFCPSGTQSNLTALLAHCQRGDEYISGDAYHVYRSEAGGAAVLGGISPCPLPTDADGTVAPQTIEAAIKPDDFHRPISRLICLENTHAGKALPAAYIEEVSALAKAHGLALHLDGARLMNAAVALGEEPARLSSGADSVSLCLSKSLGAPVGTVLAGSRGFIAKARRNRKLLGGGMRQAGLLAACGLVALERNIDRLADDHGKADQLAEALGAIVGVTVEPQDRRTNMVYLAVAPADHAPLKAFLAARGILVNGPAPRFRLVTHLDFDGAAIPRVAGGFQAYFASRH